MEPFIPGQRWVSTTESELGLGLILEAGFNRVTVLYLACNERRVYASDNAPLARAVFSVADRIESIDGKKFQITGLHRKDGLITYACLNELGEKASLDEIEINHHSQFNKPQDRLFTGQFDPSSWYRLRYKTWCKRAQYQQLPVKGLLGGRTSLIPHQVYIAHEVANRISPRIMLADEVGLGKTIEAGLILHHRWMNGLTRRVLIIVPDSLLHQWLVEMLRRFNLRFSIFDEARCLDEVGGGLDEEDSEAGLDNPFLTEQLVLSSTGFFSRYPDRQQQAVAAGWDMVIVDEAHHLVWNGQSASSEYWFVEQLALSVPSLILLTATPEQMGKESHFARLRLLDPARFYSFQAFLAEEQHFEPVAKVASHLLADQTLTADTVNELAMLVKDDNVATLLQQLNVPEHTLSARKALIGILLDLHGTGRILFRNSRHTVKGFPKRECLAYPLRGQANTEDWQQDPRYQWLVEMLRRLAGQKFLLICKQAATAIALEHTLKNRAGIAAAVFHEGLSIIERDRAAAYFADPDSKARLLICSEIGSEGRNFQFVCHLVLFDLPDNPDLLQQRIGRLDRIGQKQTIQIHVPYLENTAQALLFRWYHEGLDAFHHNSSAAQAVAEQLHEELQGFLAGSTGACFAEFLQKTKALAAELEQHLHDGRDHLLELNSCRKEIAENLIEQLNVHEQDGTLWPYLEEIFECYGVDTEYHSPGCYILRPGDHMRVSRFPALPDDGLTVTVSRNTALAREDMQFLTLEHPMVMQAMDMVLTSETGNAVVSVIKHPKLKAGQFLLECLYVVECSAPPELKLSRFLPETAIRVVVDQNQNEVTAEFPYASLVESGASFDQHKIVAFLSNHRAYLAAFLEKAEQLAEQDKRQILATADQAMLDALVLEIKRLARLQKLNPTLQPDELEKLKDFTALSHEAIQTAQLRLDAVRFVVAS